MASIKSITGTSIFNFLIKPRYNFQNKFLDKIVLKNRPIYLYINNYFPKYIHQSTITRKKKDNDEFSISQIDYINKLELDKPKSPTKELLDDAVTFDGEENLKPQDIWHSNPYKSVPKNVKKQLQGSHFKVPNLDVNKASIILFPGQGTQFVGMPKKYIEIPTVRDLYSAASEILGYDLLKLSLEGPASELIKTEYQQPAIFVASLAAVEKLREDFPETLHNCVATAGFSLGEITALTFAGAISFESAISLVKIRGEAMQIASDMNPSGMLSVFYGHDAKIGFACNVALEYCRKLQMNDVDCKIASFLYPTCKVIAGNIEALNFIIKNQESFKIRKIKRLDVSGAFHTDLMKPAAEIFKKALHNTHLSDPRIPVYSNVDGKRYKNKEHIRTQLPKQIYKPVMWEQIMHVLYERPKNSEQPFTYTCGPGAQSIKSLLQQNNAKAVQKCHFI